MRKFYAIAALVGLGLACRTRCESGSICGNDNTVSPTTVVTNNTTTTVASPTPTPNCVAQTAPFVCTKGSSVFVALVEDVERGLAPAPEPIFVTALVEALNARTDVCAVAGPSSDEVTVKARVSNSLSETIDVVREDGAIQAIPAAPKNICIPSRF